MLKAVLIDDELLASKLLEAMVKEMNFVEVVGVFSDPTAALEKIERLKPDIIFLDIEMPELNGIKFAEKMEQFPYNSDIIFVTAYDQYALDAFNVQAVDYILKPIEKSRLVKSVERIMKRRKSIQSSEKDTNKISAKFFGSFHLIDASGERFNWRTKKVKELAAYLIHNNGPVHRHKIMEDLWSDTPIDRASTILHTTVYQLRKKLRDYGMEDPILYKGEEYSFTFEVTSDEKKLKEYLFNGDVDRVTELYKAGYLCEEDYFWSHLKSEELRKQVVQFLESAVELIDRPNSKALMKLFEMEPWEERYAVKLVEYYVGQENFKEAQNIVASYELAVRQELGLEPRKDFLDLLMAKVNHVIR